MGRVRLRSIKRTHWAKGDACESNPKANNFRCQINWKEFGKNPNQPLLLATIPDSILVPTAEKDNIISCSQSIGGQSTYLTHTFGHVLNQLKTSDQFSHEILAVLNSVIKATEDSIEDPKDSDYFCSFVSLLNPTQQMKHVVSSIIYLLSVVMKKVSHHLICKSTPILIPKMVYIIDNMDDFNDASIYIIDCICMIFENVDKDFIKNNCDQIEHIYTKLLTLLSHDNNNVCVFVRDSLQKLIQICHGETLDYFLHHTVKYMKIFFSTTTTYPTMNSSQELAPNVLQFIVDIASLLPDKKLVTTLGFTMKYIAVCDKKTRIKILECWKSIFSSSTQQLSIQYIGFYQQIYNLTNELWMNSTNNYENVLSNILVSEVASLIIAFIYKLDSNIGILLIRNYLDVYFRRVLKQNVVAYKKTIYLIKKIICFEFLDQSAKETNMDDQRKATLLDTYKIVLEGLDMEESRLFKNILNLIQAYTIYFGPENTSVIKESIQPLIALYFNTKNQRIRNLLITTLGTVVSVVGPEQFISQINLNNFPDLCWLFQFLKTNMTHNVSISFFIEQLYPFLLKLSSNNNNQDHDLTNNYYANNNLVIFHAWELLPSFCLYANDVAKLKQLGNVLVRLLQESNCDYYSMVLKSLRNIVHNKVDSDKDLPFFSRKFLPILFNVYTNEIQQNTSINSDITTMLLPSYLMNGSLLEAIRSLLNGANYDLIVSFFDKAIEKVELLSSNRLIHLFDIIAEFAFYIPTSKIRLLFDNIINVYINKIQSDFQSNKQVDAKLLKKILRMIENILMNICCEKSFIVTNFGERIDEILDITSNVSTDKSVQSVKIGCIGSYIKLIASEKSQLKTYIIKYLPEIILSFGNTSGKCRLRAIHVLVDMTNNLVSSNDITNVVDIFVKFILQGLDGTIETCIASVRALIFYIKVFKKQMKDTLQSHILFSIVTHLKVVDKSSVVRPILNLFKIVIKAFMIDVIRQFYPTIMESIFSIKPHIRSKFVRHIRIILERLLSKFTYDQLSIATPIEHRKLLEAVAKEIRNEKRKSNSNSQKYNGRSTTSNVITRGLIETEEPIDLFSQKLKQHTHISRTTSSQLAKNRDDCNEYKLNSDGKIIVGAFGNRIGLNSSDDDDGNIDLSHDNKDNHVNAKSKQKQTKSTQRLNYGEQYKAKKARGDMKIRGKPDPYAYIPLSLQILNKRKVAKLKGQFNGIVRAVNKNKRT